MSSPAETACCRCREQKLRCSRERPTCARCLRLGFYCAFPAPPDRKMLAARRTPAKKRRADEYVFTALPPGGAAATLPSPAVFPADAQEPHHQDQQASSPPSTDGRGRSCAMIVASLAPSLQRFLIDTFFSHMYNSTLLFHKPTLLREFDAGAVPSHVLVAIFASATVFLKPCSPLYKACRPSLEGLGDIITTGRLWARTAGREALQLIDLPCVANVRTCQMMALYWFAEGQSRQNTMFSGIAYKAACVLGLDHQVDSVAQLGPKSERADGDAPAETVAWLEEETRRRLFWATWLTNCINSEHYTVGTSVNDRIMSLGLPENEALFHSPTSPLPPATMTISGSDEICAANQARGTTSIMAELVQLMRIWAAIGDYFAGRAKKPLQQNLAEHFSLDQRLAAWYKTLHPSLAYSKRNLYKQLVIDQQPTYVFVHALHHQCRLVLHVSMVPQFSGLPGDSRLSPEMVKASAMVALRSARAISKLCSDLIALDWDFPRLAPFVGYCIYASASIHIVFLFLDNDRLAHLAKTQLVSNLRVLRVIKDYWTNLERLWARIRILFDAQTSHSDSRTERTAGSTDDEATRDDPETYLEDAFEEDSEDHEISVLAQRSRDAGKLQEPLSNSILKYNLELRPVPAGGGGGGGGGSGSDPTAAASSLHNIEKLIYTDVLGRVANRETCHRSTLQKQQQHHPHPPSFGHERSRQPMPGVEMGINTASYNGDGDGDGTNTNLFLAGLHPAPSINVAAGAEAIPGSDMLLGLPQAQTCGGISTGEYDAIGLGGPSPDDMSIDMLDVLPFFTQDGSHSDGWQMGLDSLTDTMLSHGDLFS